MSLGVIDRSVSHQLQKRFKELQKEFLAKQTDATEQRQIGQAMDKLFDRLFFLPKRRKRKHEEVTKLEPVNVQLDHEIEAVQKEMRQFAANLKSQVQFGYSEQVIDQVAVQLQLASDLPHDTLYNQPPLVSVDALQKMIDIFDENLSEVEKEKEAMMEQLARAEPLVERAERVLQGAKMIVPKPSEPNAMS